MGLWAWGAFLILEVKFFLQVLFFFLGLNQPQTPRGDLPGGLRGTLAVRATQQNRQGKCQEAGIITVRDRRGLLGGAPTGLPRREPLSATYKTGLGISPSK